METEKPQTLMNLAFVYQEGTEVTFMHAFADIEGMRLHWQGADERAQHAYEYVEPTGRSTGRRGSRSWRGCEPKQPVAVRRSPSGRSS